MSLFSTHALVLIRGFGAWLTEENRQKLAWLGGAIAVLIGAVWAAFIYFDAKEKKPATVINLIAEGNRFLNNGQYDQAKQSFQKAFAIDKQDEEAAWGLSKTEPWEAKEAAVFDQKIQNLYDKNPKDAHVNVFMGNRYAAEHQWGQALPFYQQAIALNPKLAEAHFDLGVLYQQQGRLAEAQKAYQQAVDLAKIPKYQSNQAYLYLKTGDYDHAITAYGNISKQPLAALEMAKAYWLRGQPDDLKKAEQAQRQALRWLLDNEVMVLSGNPEPWYFPIGGGVGVKLVHLAEKQDYAHYALSVSLFLQGNSKAAQDELKHLQKVWPLEIKKIIMVDLANLAQHSQPLGKLADAYKSKFLSKR